MARETCKRDIFIKSAKLKAFHSVVTSHSLRQGIQSLMEVAGLGKLRPNTLMLGYKNQWMLQEQTVVNEYVDILHDAFDLNFGVAILRMPDGLYGDASVPLQLAELVDAGISAEQNDTMERAETKQLGQKLRSQLGPHGDLGRTNLNESSQQNSRDGRLSTLMQKQKSYFSERQPKGTIDVWWLYDDGGLTVLLPHLLSLSPSWSRCRIRIFAPVTEQLSTEEVRMTSLLRKFRISFSSVIMLSEMKSRPSSESVEEFMKLPGGEESNREDVKEKTFRHIRLGELLRQHSTNAKLIVVTMPIPRKNTCSSILYMSWLETISCKLPPILFVRGNQQSVLTFQS
ncbi:solute carrier family 12 member 1-like [Corticium candelabrum]|uniref:solute carrier family 12 member 1-like n=1 Tax=Corticium candelabrum TaxID=121492 RepID=UPI002E260FC9|nr:solute carrier family 12 member 1-like [Corticium candelabrum]